MQNSSKQFRLKDQITELTSGDGLSNKQVLGSTRQMKTMEESNQSAGTDMGENIQPSKNSSRWHFGNQPSPIFPISEQAYKMNLENSQLRFTVEHFDYDARIGRFANAINESWLAWMSFMTGDCEWVPGSRSCKSKQSSGLGTVNRLKSSFPANPFR